MARAKKSCLNLTILLETLSNHYWTNCPMTLGLPNIGQLNMPWTMCPKYTKLYILSNDSWTICPVIIGLIAQILLDTLSNQYWTQCPMIISHIDQCLLDKFQINIGQNIDQLNLPWTMRPRYTRFNILSNEFWTHYPMTIYYTESITLHHHKLPGHYLRWLLKFLLAEQFWIVSCQYLMCVSSSQNQLWIYILNIFKWRKEDALPFIKVFQN